MQNIFFCCQAGNFFYCTASCLGIYHLSCSKLARFERGRGFINFVGKLFCETLKHLKTKNCVCNIMSIWRFFGLVLLKEIKRAHRGYHKNKGCNDFTSFCNFSSSFGAQFFFEFSLTQKRKIFTSFVDHSCICFFTLYRKVDKSKKVFFSLPTFKKHALNHCIFNFFNCVNTFSSHCPKFNMKEEKPSQWQCRQISYILEV